MSALVKAADDSYEAVEEMHKGLTPFETKAAMAEIASRCKRRSTLEFLRKQYPSYNRRLAAEKAAAAADKIYSIEHLVPNYEEDLLVVALESAARNGHVGLMELIGNHDPTDCGENYEPYPSPDELYEASDALGEAARAGQRAAAEWMLDNLYEKGQRALKVFARTTREDRQDVVELLCECCSAYAIESTLHAALSAGCHLDVVKTIFDPVKAASEFLSKFTKMQDPDTDAFLHSLVA